MGTHKWLALIMTLTAILFSGCSNPSSQQTIAQFETKMATYENENTELKNQIKELKSETGKYQEQIARFNEQMNILQPMKEQQKVYQQNFQEAEKINIPRSMYVEDAAEMKIYPYESAHIINSISDRYVIVHTKVINDQQEEWALIEAIDFVNTNNYGYIRLKDLVRKSYVPAFKCAVESISDVKIGDSVEKAITQFGNDYVRYKTEIGWSYGFKDSVFIGIDPISYTMKSIIVRAEGFNTKEGIQVGDNAKEAIELYKSKYRMNKDELLLKEYPESTFDLGKGYYLQIKFDTQELTDDSIITEILIFSISDGDY